MQRCVDKEEEYIEGCVNTESNWQRKLNGNATDTRVPLSEQMGMN